MLKVFENIQYVLKQKNTIMLTSVDTVKVPLVEICSQILLGDVVNAIYSGMIEGGKRGGKSSNRSPGLKWGDIHLDPQWPLKMK